MHSFYKDIQSICNRWNTYWIQYFVKILLVLISTFKSSCQTPLLVDLTLTCIIDIVEIAIKINMDLPSDSSTQFYVQSIRFTQNWSTANIFLGWVWWIPLPSRPIRLEIIKNLSRSNNNDLADHFLGSPLWWF